MVQNVSTRQHSLRIPAHALRPERQDLGGFDRLGALAIVVIAYAGLFALLGLPARIWLQ